ncbi:hypothetical protein N7532_009693 [Penicillium argentinense]|uniref:cytochrome-b5 reductase n=1 Tax=Penicillium argentinense TaxID=1131581 RepID=A0A9W9EZR0_9EURO|nr:uncharacterized protein N7532_009693 [Penicillium argentinense]KAJ5091009.1 hypothetical protein N7532_009693 [Penicillium argentinense]
MSSQPYLDRHTTHNFILTPFPRLSSATKARFFHLHYRKSPLAYVRCSTFTIGKPDLTYHAGETEDAPITAVCKFINFSRHCKVGLGNPDDPNVAWEDLTRHKLTTHYRFEITLDSGERRAFIWKRTNSVGIGEEKPSKISSRNFKLQDDQTEELVAVYLNNGTKSWKKSGKFQINVDYGVVFDTMVASQGPEPTEFQDFELKEINSISHNIAIYRFFLNRPTDILGLPIGQHISLTATIDGQLKEVIRSYTPISSNNEANYFDLLVEAYPQGNISKYITTLKVGQTMKIIEAIIRNRPCNGGNDTTKFDLIFANVNPEDILLQEKLDKLTKEDEGFNVYYVLTARPRSELVMSASSPPT